MPEHTNRILFRRKSMPDVLVENLRYGPGVSVEVTTYKGFFYLHHLVGNYLTNQLAFKS